MGTEETSRFLARVYAAYARGDMPTVFAAFADDVAWCSQGGGTVLPKPAVESGNLHQV